MFIDDSSPLVFAMRRSSVSTGLENAWGSATNARWNSCWTLLKPRFHLIPFGFYWRNVAGCPHTTTRRRRRRNRWKKRIGIVKKKMKKKEKTKKKGRKKERKKEKSEEKRPNRVEGRWAPPDTLTSLNGLKMADVRSPLAVNVTFASKFAHFVQISCASHHI